MLVVRATGRVDGATGRRDPTVMSLSGESPLLQITKLEVNHISAPNHPLITVRKGKPVKIAGFSSQTVIKSTVTHPDPGITPDNTVPWLQPDTDKNGPASASTVES
ncbi:MAG: hypothetical protein ACRDTF_03255, partial [Pseudonocardiaceae bacterium]